MAWIEGNQNRPINEFANINEQIANIEGYIEEDEAKILLYKFFRHNITYATNVFMGVKLFPFQHLAIKTMLDTDYTLNIWSRGLSKSFSCGIYAVLDAIFNQGIQIGILSAAFRQCPTSDSLILTKRGLIKIKDIKIGEEVFARDNWQKIRDKWKNETVDGLRVTTKKGYSIAGKKEHSILTFNKTKQSFEYKDSKNIKIGDIIPISLNNKEYGQNILKEFKPKIKLNHRSKPLILSTNEKEFYYLLGSFIGDGTFRLDGGQKRFEFTSGDQESIDWVKNYVQFLLPENKIEEGFKKDKNGNPTNTKYLTFNSNALGELFEFFGYETGKNAITKVIPEKVFQSTKENISSFMQGLMDTDGSACFSKKSKEITLSTSSKEIAQKFQLLLLNFGIVSNLSTEPARGDIEICGVKTIGRESYKVRITGYDNIKKYYDNINFKLQRKSLLTNDYLKNTSEKTKKSNVIIPGINKYITKKYKGFDGRQEWSKTKLKQNLASGKITSNEDIELCNNLINEDIFFDYVEDISIEKNAETYDIEVENEHCYWGNGFINHNSKQIFRKIEDIASKPEAVLLNQLIGNRGVSKGNDEWILKIGDSTIRALPLGDGCLAPNTLINTDSGFYFIEDLFPEINLQDDHQEFPVSPSFSIKSLKGFLPSDQKFYNGIRDTLKITTNLGYEIEGTLNHKFKVVCPKTGEFIWKPLENITHEDYLVMSANESWHKNETNITEEEAYVTGLLIGDGCFTRPSNIGFSTKDKELVVALEKSKVMKSWSQHADGVHYYGIGGEQMKQNFMSKMEISNDHIDTLNKRFPSKILQSNKKIVANFISGLFDSDGGIQIQSRKGYDSCCVSFYNSSKILIQQLHQILLHFGIKSNFDGGRERKYDKRFGEIDWNTAYALQITGVDVKKFYEEIGFKLKRKQDLLESFCQNKKRWFNIGKNDHINCMREILVNEITQNKLKPKNKNLNLSKLKKKKYLTQQCLESYIQNFGIKKKYSHLINDGVFFQQVDSIVESKSPTYDLHVPSTHEYNASGFIVHNSKLRGFRFHRIIIDEMLLMPERIYNEVILPFLAVTDNPDKQEELAAAEDILIAQGKMKEEDRYVWPNNKLIALSSASYKFEYLYKFYKTYENLIMNPDSYGLESETGEENLSGSETATRAIIQLSYDCAPRKLYDKTLIKQSIATMSQSQFDREFGAKFTDDSSGYFKISRMAACNVPYGETPSVEIIGDPDGKYIVAIDPSWAENDSSDDFALHLFKLNDDKKMGTVVHSYALSNTRLKDHVNYFLYILTYFNVVAIIGDYMGGLSFMNSCNESKAFIDAGIELKRFENIDFDNVEKYQEALEEASEQYRPEEGVYYIHLQNPSSGWIRRANEYLQGCFDHKKIKFAADAVDEEFTRQKKAKIPINDLKFRNRLDDEELAHYEEDMKDSKSKIVEFIEHQTNMIDLIKAESALIQITTSPQGTQTFDLPKNLRNQTGPNKTRKDSYSAMVLGNWMIKLYYGFTNFERDVEAGFIPRFIK